MKCSLGISNFLEEISSLTHSVVFLYFFALTAEEGFLISPCCSLELCIQMFISFLSPLLFASLLFTAICKASSDSHFAFLHFFSMASPVCCLHRYTILHIKNLYKGTYVYLWLIHVDIWQKTTKFCEAIILQLKNKLKKKNFTNELILFFSNENLREKAGRQDRLKEYKFKVNFALG